MAALLLRYQDALFHSPLLVKTVTGVSFAAVGDAAAQRLEQRGSDRMELDFTRLASFASFGAFWTGPVNHVYLRALHNRFQHEVGMRGLAKKLAIHHAFVNPCLYLPGFLAYSAACKGLDPPAVRQYCTERYAGGLASIWGFWVPASIFIFTKVREPSQSVVMAGMSLVFNTLFSLVVNPSPSGLSAAGPAPNTDPAMTTRKLMRHPTVTPISLG